MMSCLFRFVCLPGSCLPVCCPNYMHLSTQHQCVCVLWPNLCCSLFVCYGLVDVVIVCFPLELHAPFFITPHTRPVQCVFPCCGLFFAVCLFVCLFVCLLLLGIKEVLKLGLRAEAQLQDGQNAEPRI